MATLSAAETETLLPELAELLHASVHAGASVSFVLPYSPDDALAFWRDKVLPGVAGGGLLLVVAAWQDGRLAGAVQLDCDTRPINRTAPRCASCWCIRFRRQGIARALMAKVEALAVAAGRSLITLDTRTGDRAEPLYASLGYVTVGVIRASAAIRMTRTGWTAPPSCTSSCSRPRAGVRPAARPTLYGGALPRAAALIFSIEPPGVNSKSW